MAAKTLEQAFNPRENAYGFLRLAFAALVVVSHGFSLGGWKDPVVLWSENRENLGSLMVYGFFAISGFLILRSWDDCPSLTHYLRRRALRILPAFWVTLLVTAFFWAPLWWWLEHGQPSREALFGPGGSLAYLERSFWLDVEQEQGIAGLLGNNPVPTWVNAPLWTLRYEAICYLALAALGWLGLLRGKRPAAITVAFFAFWLMGAMEYAREGAGTSLLGHLADEWFLRLAPYFFAGAFFYLNRDRIPIDRRLFAACSVVLLYTLKKGGFQAASVVTLPYVVHYLAATLPLRRFGSHGDYSYGLYVFTFPLQQTLALLGTQQHGRLLFITASLLGGLAFAVPSWHLVEAPLLSRRRSSAGASPLAVTRLDP